MYEYVEVIAPPQHAVLCLTILSGFELEGSDTQTEGGKLPSMVYVYGKE